MALLPLGMEIYVSSLKIREAISVVWQIEYSKNDVVSTFEPKPHLLKLAVFAANYLE